MKAEWIQVTATKDQHNWAICSNTGLMENGVGPAEALGRLQAMAAEYADKGYSIQWDREPLSSYDLEFYGDLFAAEQWEEDQRIYAEFG